MTITAEPTSETIETRPDRVAVRDFTIYRDVGQHTVFESTGDLTVLNGKRNCDLLAFPPDGKVAVILNVDGDFTEVLVDDHVDALAQLDGAIVHLTAARERLAAMLGADSEAIG